MGFAVATRAQESPDWSQPMAPFHIIGNVYYVGSKGLGSYLITTPEGHILINSGMVTSVPLIHASVEKLGFKYSDIKVLLISHSHWDHCAGSASLIRETGAKYMVMEGDAEVVEAGGKTDFNYYNSPTSWFEPVKADRVLHDGDEVKLGGTTLVAHKTPGHTKGCTTWTMKATEAGKSHDVVVIGSPNVNAGYKLVNNARYPEIAQDYETMFRVLKALPCDIYLGAHGDYFGLLDKVAKMTEGGANPFIDPKGYQDFLAAKEGAFRAELKKQQP